MKKSVFLFFIFLAFLSTSVYSQSSNRLIPKLGYGIGPVLDRLTSPGSYSSNTSYKLDGKKCIMYPDQIHGFVLVDNYKETLFKNSFTSQEYGITSEQLMHVIYEGKTKLLAKEFAKITNRIVPRISRKTAFYLVLSHNNLKKIELNKSNIMKALNVTNNDLSTYAITINLILKMNLT